MLYSLSSSPQSCMLPLFMSLREVAFPELALTPVAAVFDRVGAKGRFKPEGRKTLTQDIVVPSKNSVMPLS